jgi:hypothetical protein
MEDKFAFRRLGDAEEPMDMRLYHDTCKYVETVLETFNQSLSVADWERVVRDVYNQMKFLVPTPPSANPQPTGD